VIRYRLGHDAAVSRARATALVGAANVLAPVLLIVVLLHKLGFGPWARGAQPNWATWTVVGLVTALAALALVRAIVVYRRLLGHLGAFEVTLEGDVVTVETPSARLTVPRTAIARATEVPGTFGGLRLELAASEDAPDRVEIPRGGERFGELRARIEAWRAVEPARRRGRAARLAIGAVIVVAIFFLPFVLDDFFGRSRLLALVLVVGLWLAMRVLTRRG
jgi:hypothetical protein